MGSLLFKDGKPAFRNGKPLIGGDPDCCCVQPTLCVEGCTTPDPETVSVTLDGVLRNDVFEDYMRIQLGPPFTEYIECECPTYFNGITFVLQKHPSIACRWEAFYPMSPKPWCVNEIRLQALLQSIAGVRQWSLSISLGSTAPLITTDSIQITFTWILPPGDTCNGIFTGIAYTSLVRKSLSYWPATGPCEFTNMTAALDTTP